MELGLLYSMSTDELWELFHDEIIVKIEGGNNSKIYDFVKNGGKIKYDIEMILNKINIRQKAKSGKILVNRKVYSLPAFYEEMRYRKTLMRRWLKQNMGGMQMTNPREAKEVQNGQ